MLRQSGFQRIVTPEINTLVKVLSSTPSSSPVSSAQGQLRSFIRLLTGKRIRERFGFYMLHPCYRFALEGFAVFIAVS